MERMIIPFNLETAMKIQAGEIDGKILDYYGSEVEIVTFKGLNTYKPILIKFHFSYGDKFVGADNNGVYDNGKLALAVPNEIQFKPFDKVLVRNDEKMWWRCTIFSHYRKDHDYRYVCSNGAWLYCIPYEGNERFVGKNDKPQEDQYGNR